MLEGILHATYVNRTHADALIAMMTMQSINHKIPRLLPSIRTVFQDHASILRIASKSGEMSSAGINDTFGRKGVLVVGILLFLGGSALCGLSQTMPQLILFRALQGAGSASLA